MSLLGKITSIQPQRAHPDRVNLFVNEEFVLSIQLELAYQLRLRVGMDVTAEDVDLWKQQEEQSNAYELAVRYLSARARSRQQVTDYLARKSIAAETIEYVLGRLESFGYLSDNKFATEFVRSRILNKPRGKRMIRWELQQRGVAKDVIEQAMDEYVDEAEAAARLIAKKSSFHKQNDPQIDRQTAFKIAQYLARKGFKRSTIEAVLRDWRQTHA
ncbi:regulatory protein RecX [Effusibacillus dendaii]|uniref:Regulatory protein RecX n=1 Tax=Effusibacillus dendaii TaxID=2743772 RepID=A0A7I8DA97_9BACL|nr:RecX family transcriptional regulator [Effusibacillus dendaii]BCJ85746.1 hypothetical protein skT53_07310 [Effusibacillus dendaii]